LVVGRRTPAALMLAAAAVLAFLAHEPLLVLLGHRGPRAARDDRSRALVWFASTALGAAILGAAAFVDAPAGIHLAPAAAVPAAAARMAGVLAPLGSIAALVALAALRVVSVVAPIAALPTCLVALIAALVAPSARRLRAIGWTLLATTLLGAALLVAAFG